MNRKARDRQSPGKFGPEHDNQAHSVPGRYLEYENIPDPISFDEISTGSVQPASNNRENAEEQKLN